MIDLDAAGGAEIAVGEARVALQRVDARDEPGMELAASRRSLSRSCGGRADALLAPRATPGIRAYRS